MNTFQIKTKVIMGTDALYQLEHIEGGKVFVVCDPFLIKNKTIDSILDNMKNRTVEIFSDITPDPSLEVISNGLEKMLDFKPELLLAVGGGSAIDSAKLIHNIYQKNVKNIRVKFVAVPTTSGTGTEATAFSVVTDEDKQIKHALISEEFLPDIAILEPKITLSVPPVITADTGMDVLTHAIEACVSVKANDFTDALAEKAIQMVLAYLPKAVREPEDIQAREKMQNAACMAGMAFNETSLGLNHAMAHALGARFHISHGKSNAMLLCPVMRFHAGFPNSKAPEAYFRLAKLLHLQTYNLQVGAENLIKCIERLRQEIGIPQTIHSLGINTEQYEEAIDDMAEAAMLDNCLKTNPVKVNTYEVESIYRQLI